MLKQGFIWDLLSDVEVHSRAALRIEVLRPWIPRVERGTGAVYDWRARSAAGVGLFSRSNSSVS
jgi:hypothetical protein